MLIHSVYFWFRPDADPELVGKFRDGLARLVTIPDVQAAQYGRPAATERRSVIDDTYAWALIATFADTEAHDRYQAHPVHTAFVREFGPIWSQVRVYDAQV